MNPFSPFGMPGFDPSKMDPKLLMELSQLVQQLPPEQLRRMQTLMHNAMAGFDVRKDLEEFERELPQGFREKVATLMARQAASSSSGSIAEAATPSTLVSGATAEVVGPPKDLYEARMTVLRGVASGQVSPEDAEKILFQY